MKKKYVLTFILIFLCPSLAFAKAVRSYGCKAEQDGATVKLFDRTLGFSSVESCEQQVEYLANGSKNAVICGCNADNSPAGAFLALMGAMVGVIQTNMNLECFKFDGAEWSRVRFISHGVIREINPSNKRKNGTAYFGDRVEACRQQEAQLFYELNSFSNTAETPSAVETIN